MNKVCKKYYDHIPTYEELKNLDKNEEHYFIIFNLSGSAFIQISYNEDFLGKISLDYLESTCLHSLYIGTNIDIMVNYFYKLTRKNYNEIIKALTIIKNRLINELTKYNELN